MKFSLIAKFKFRIKDTNPCPPFSEWLNSNILRCLLWNGYFKKITILYSTPWSGLQETIVSQSNSAKINIKSKMENHDIICPENTYQKSFHIIILLVPHFVSSLVSPTSTSHHYVINNVLPFWSLDETKYRLKTLHGFRIRNKEK